MPPTFYVRRRELDWVPWATTLLITALGAVACKPNAPHEPPHVLVPPSPVERSAYGVCPPQAVRCDPARLRMLQDSLAAMQKRHRSRDSLRTSPPLRQNWREWRFYLLGENTPENRAQADEDRFGGLADEQGGRRSGGP